MSGVRPMATCPRCGTRREISTRVRRHIASGKATGVCGACARGGPLVEVTDRYRSYWLARYTMEEIRELAAGLDALLSDHSRFAHDPAARDKHWAA